MTGTFKRFTPDEKDFIKEYAPGHSRAEITEALNKRFDANRSITSVDNYIQRNKIRTGYIKGHEYTSEELVFLRNYVPGRFLSDITVAFNRRFDLNVNETSLAACLTRNNIKSGVARFTTDQISKRAKPIGTERKQNNYIYIKTEDGWHSKQQVLYEEVYGKVQEHSMVIFLDGNSDNFDIDNLMAIDKRINVIMNIYKLPRNSKEQTIASIQTAALIAGIIDAKERAKEKNHDT